jgi:hypothetical protein
MRSGTDKSVPYKIKNCEDLLCLKTSEQLYKL